MIFIVYWLIGGAIAAVLGTRRIGILTWQFWAILGLVALAVGLAGRI